MTTANATHSVGQIDSFVLMLQAACEDAVMNKRLERLLSMPDEQRRALVHTWVADMLIAQAPRDLIQAVACLGDDGVAEKAYQVIYACQRWLAPTSTPRSH